jgi:uncharacterized protein with PIN domain/sulfur carrier protein ThiS
MMSRARLQFHAELNDFLPPARRQICFVHTFNGRVSVKDMIESLGVPHTEVAGILVNGVWVDFAYLVQEGDRIDVYPASAQGDTAPPTLLRPPLVGTPRFVLDTHLGQLAAYLRMLGFDTLYRNDYSDEELARLASAEGRILLTRDRGLLKRSIVTYGYYLRETDPQRQVAEVLRRFDLVPAIRPLRRCMRCNGLLRPVPKEAISARLEPKTRAYYDEFSICETCDQIYWKGSHYERMQVLIQGLVGR